MIQFRDIIVSLVNRNECRTIMQGRMSIAIREQPRAMSQDLIIENLNPKSNNQGPRPKNQELITDELTSDELIPIELIQVSPAE